MPNPNYSELRLLSKYGPDSAQYNLGGLFLQSQNQNVYVAVSEDSDEIDHKWVFDVPLGGLYIELAHYVSVKQVVLQNMSAFNGSTFYVDNTTGDLVPGFVLPGEHVSFCDPDVTAGIMLYSIAAQELTEWEMAICGRKD
ncbi:MAG: hypothetical protein ACXABY_07915 [Candidatus Thorarchaeota archaeon]|jgi:hypothetical protein